MNALCMEVVNGQAPYKVTQDPERPYNFYIKPISVHHLI
jgi:hypothetical protein